jgi:hypothetical protein
VIVVNFAVASEGAAKMMQICLERFYSWDITSVHTEMSTAGNNTL